LDNTVLAVHNGNASKKQSAPELLNRLGLGDRLSHRPAELSAGEKQRTAIARAMINNPNLILADEPTGNLDPQNAQEVIQYLSEYRDQGGTVIVVTHGSVADEQADRIVTLENGTLVPQK
jgi:ABC-type lipoprotein export system ATPase subunit